MGSMRKKWKIQKCGVWFLRSWVLLGQFMMVCGMSCSWSCMCNADIVSENMHCKEVTEM
jgi:hypothetical protein